MDEISLHILDIIQNSVKAGATLIKISIEYNWPTGILTVTIEDNGCGMDQEMVIRVTDPFVTTRTTRKVGLGLPMFKASAEGTGGNFEVKSQKGSGTTVKAVFNYKHIDCPPLGNMTDTIISQVISYKDIDFEYIFSTEAGRMEFSSREIKNVLGGSSMISEPAVIEWMRQSINNEIKEIGGGDII